MQDAYDEPVTGAEVNAPSATSGQAAAEESANAAGGSSASIIARLAPAMPSRSWIGWLGPLAVTLIGGILRFASLGRPNGIAFDETYYPFEALSYLRYGYEQGKVDKANEILLSFTGDWHALNIFNGEPAFVVHPPLGKWTLALGELMFGANPFGWRFPMAVLGTLSILIVARTMRRMTRSDLIGTLAGLLLALDGMHLVLSRTGLLDMTLSFWVLVAFALLVLDRDVTRRRLARRADVDTWQGTRWGPPLGLRPLRWAAILALGLACSVKWSGMYFAVAFLLMSLVWDVGARRIVGVRSPWVATAARSLPSTVAIAGGGIVAVYLASWTGWFLNPDAYGRAWADAHPSSWIPASVRSLWHYHAEAWNFHVTLSSPHAYASNPLSWPFQSRPTSFFWEAPKLGEKGCEVDSCAQEVLALGNPVIWWVGIVAIIHQAWRWLARRDWRSGAVLVGIAAGWLPWMLYLNRTIFTFYTVVFVPYLVMALAMTLGALLGPSTGSPTRRRWGAFAVGAIVLLVVIVAWWMYPVWTGVVMPRSEWQLRMWMPTWI